MDRDTRLGILAAAILEGTPVDWSSVDSTGDATDRKVVAQLQVLSEIAALHRSHPPLDSPGATLPVPATPRPASTAWGHLQRLTLLGHGTYGDVYRAWDPHLEREVALKLLRTHPAPSGPGASISDPTRVVDEGRLLARVRHPHVITVYGAEPRDGLVGIWMELIQGRTLHQLVEQQGPLGAREAAGVGLDLCRALAAVHAAGLIHRDVTARNVMREDGGRIVLMDFGAGRERRAASERAPSLAGTPLYMAPEMFAGAPADERADIYSLGVLLFYVVTGQFPVSGRSLDQVRGAHTAGTRVRLRDTRPDLPAAFVRTIERALTAAPAERFQTAGAFEAALETALLPDRTAVPSTRRWRLALGTTAAAVVIGAVAWGTGALPRGAGGSGGGSPESAVATSVAMRQLSAMPQVSRPSNPSADGRFVAASSTTSGDAVLVDLSTGSLQPLGVDRLEASDQDGYASTTVLAPDGRMVAVNWWQDNRGSLRIVRTDGTGLRALAGGDDIRDVTPYQWSHDGSMLLTAIVGQDGVATLALLATEDGAVRPLHRLSGWVNELPQQMSLSPDGRYVVYDYPESAATADRDIFVVDAHTGEQWPLVAAPGHDVSPLWSPDGREIVFVSDRSRTPSAWAVAVERGRASAPPRLVKEELGRVRPRGFTANGAWHVDLTTGHPEVLIAQFEQPSPAPLSPRMAFGNFYPVWSRDGRMLAYASERNDRSNRELWVFDTSTGRESPVVVAEPVGLPIDFAPDGSKLLVAGANNGRLLVAERATGRASLVAGCSSRARWLAAGIVCEGPRQVVLRDAVSGRAVRTFDFSEPDVAGFTLAHDGRSVLTRHASARLVLHDVQSGAMRSWQDTGVTNVRRHALAPNGSSVAYMAGRSGPAGDVSTLMLWAGAGAPRELLRTTPGESMTFEGWTADGTAVLVTRWTPPADGVASTPIPRTLWRVPAHGDAPQPTSLSMTGLRDVALHPDGRRLAFNAGWKEYESWVVDGLLGR